MHQLTVPTVVPHVKSLLPFCPSARSHAKG